MSVENAAIDLVRCPHGMNLSMSPGVRRCTHCGAIQVAEGPWATPHFVAAFIAEWRKEHPDGTDNVAR